MIITRYARLILAAGILTQLSSLPVSAVSYFWDPLATGGAGGGTGLWDTETPSWATAATGGVNTLWVDGSDAVFAGTAGTISAVNLVAPITAGNLSFSIAGYTLTTSEAASLTLTGGITATNSAGPAVGATNITGSGQVVLNGDQTFMLTNALNIGATLAGSSTLTKSGTGSLGLSGFNTFSGKFMVLGGLLGANSDLAFGAVPSTFVADSITLDGGGLVAAVNFTGPVNFANPGTVTLDANRGITLGAAGGTFRVGFGAASTMAVNGAVTGPGALTKTDSGTLILGADNTYLGATNITGILQIGTGGATGTLGAGKITFGTGNGNFLNFNRSENLTLTNEIATGQRANIGVNEGTTITLNGPITSVGTTGEFWKQGLGTVVVVANANSNRASNNVIVNGTLQVSDLTRTTASALGTGNIYLGQATTLSSGAKFSYTGDSISTDAFQNVQTPYGIIEVTNPTTNLTFTNLFKGNDGNALVTKLGAGTWTVTGETDNTRLRVQVEAGALQLGKTSSPNIHALGGANALILNAGVARITGTGGDQIYDPSTIQINGGVFDLNGQNEGVNILTSNSPNGVITNQLPASISILTLGTNNGSSFFSGSIQDGAGAVSLVKTGTGSLTLDGVNVITTGTSVMNGRLIVSGSLTGSSTQVSGVLGGTGTVGEVVLFGGTIAPGANAVGSSVGRLTLGNLNMANGGTFEAAIDTSAMTSSVAEIHGDLTLGFFSSSLRLSEVGLDTAMALGTKLTLMSYTGLWDQGTFSGGLFGDLENHDTFTFGSNTFELTYDADIASSGTKEVTLTVVPEPGVSGLLLGGLGLLGVWRRRNARVVM